MKIEFEEMFPEYVYAYGNVISIPITDPPELNLQMDKERVANGKRPLFNKLDEKEIDNNAWYEYRLILDRKTLEPIEFEAWADYTGDEDETVYHLEIEDKEAVLADVKRELKIHGYTEEELKKEK